ncbi:MAG TPA: type II secretion system protein [Verrucomicrobiae bacterium]|nr:type II secretion system protein [Verrucomicrobiae bacterium]
MKGRPTDGLANSRAQQFRSAAGQKTCDTADGNACATNCAAPVAQTFSLPYRRLSVGRRGGMDELASLGAQQFRRAAGQKTCDTAGGNACDTAGGNACATRRCGGFTMIEIAISLAIIGFALVAIIGILPTAMNAQRDNEQETIINQDASILMDSVRNGERGLDDLTNYVIGITNYITDFSAAGRPNGTPTLLAYTPQMGYVNGGSNPRMALTNGYTIVGVLSTPKIIPHTSGVGYQSNHVVAVFRSMSGPAAEKPPQINPTMQELALNYRVIADVSGYGTNFFDPSWTNGINTNFYRVITNFQLNLHDVRLTFLWPVLPSGKLGSGRQVYRTTVGGHLLYEPTNSPNSQYYYWFFQPRNFF